MIGFHLSWRWVVAIRLLLSILIISTTNSLPAVSSAGLDVSGKKKKVHLLVHNYTAYNGLSKELPPAASINSVTTNTTARIITTGFSGGHVSSSPNSRTPPVIIVASSSSSGSSGSSKHQFHLNVSNVVQGPFHESPFMAAAWKHLNSSSNDIISFTGNKVQKLLDTENPSPHVTLNGKLGVKGWSDLALRLAATMSAIDRNNVSSSAWTTATEAYIVNGLNSSTKAAAAAAARESTSKKDISNNNNNSSSNIVVARNVNAAAVASHLHCEEKIGDVFLMAIREYWKKKRIPRSQMGGAVPADAFQQTITETLQYPIVFTTSADENWGFFSTGIGNKTAKWINMTNHLRIHNSNYATVRAFLDSEKIVLVTANSHVDPEIGAHPKIINLPLGMRNGAERLRRLQQYLAAKIYKTRVLLINNSGWGDRTRINAMVSAAFGGKVKNSYHNTNKVSRPPFVSELTQKKVQSDFYLDIAQSKFVLCPSGLGFDTYRLWEVILLGMFMPNGRLVLFTV